MTARNNASSAIRTGQRAAASSVVAQSPKPKKVRMIGTTTMAPIASRMKTMAPRVKPRVMAVRHTKPRFSFSW